MKQYQIMVSGVRSEEIGLYSLYIDIFDWFVDVTFKELTSEYFDETLTHLSEEFVVDFKDPLQGTLPYLQSSLDSLSISMWFM